MTHITIVHQGALGDSILLIPLFRALRQRFSPCSITLVSRVNLGQMLTMLGFIEGYASADDQEHTLWFAKPDSPEKPNSVPGWARADYVLSAVSDGADAWAANARAARADRDAETLLFFQPRAGAEYAGHVTQWHREQLGVLNLSAAALPLPRVNPDGVVLVHPGAGGEAKCWPRERFIALGRALKRNGILPTFLLGEAEQERWGWNLIEEMKQEFPWYLHMGLFEVADRMSRARLFVGNDSGVTHTAAAMGIPVIALFGPSDERQWSPIGPSVTILRAPPPHERSLEALEEARVLSEILAELRKL